MSHLITWVARIALLVAAALRQARRRLAAELRITISEAVKDAIAESEDMIERAVAQGVVSKQPRRRWLAGIWAALFVAVLVAGYFVLQGQTSNGRFSAVADPVSAVGRMGLFDPAEHGELSALFSASGLRVQNSLGVTREEAAQRQITPLLLSLPIDQTHCGAEAAPLMEDCTTPVRWLGDLNISWTPDLGVVGMSVSEVTSLVAFPQHSGGVLNISMDIVASPTNAFLVDLDCLRETDISVATRHRLILRAVPCDSSIPPEDRILILMTPQPQCEALDRACLLGERPLPIVVRGVGSASLRANANQAILHAGDSPARLRVDDRELELGVDGEQAEVEAEGSARIQLVIDRVSLTQLQSNRLEIAPVEVQSVALDGDQQIQSLLRREWGLWLSLALAWLLFVLSQFLDALRLRP